MIGYLLVKALCFKDRLLKEEDYLRLIEGKITLYELPQYTFLKKYEPSYNNIIKGIYEKFINRAKYFIKVRTTYIPFFYAFLDRLEVENLKTKIRSLIGGEKTPFYYPYYHFIPLDKLKEAKKLDDIISIIEKTPYYEILKLAKEYKTLIELCLDSAYYKYYKNKALKCKVDNQVIYFIDLESLIKLFYWMLVLGEDEIKKLAKKEVLIGFKPVSRRLKLEEYSIDEIIRAFKVDRKRLERMMIHFEISRALHLLEEKFIEKLSITFMKYKISFITPYFYLIASYLEMRNLEKIVLGEAMKLPPDVVKGTLTLPRPI